MLQSALLSYIKLIKYLETDGFKFNPYDPYMANNIIEGDPITVVLHVYDLKAIHKYTKVVDNFEQWIEFMYGDPNIGKVKSVRVKVHEYFSMTLDYSTKGEVKIDMRKYVKHIIDEFPIRIKKPQAVEIPATKNILKVGRSKLLNNNKVGLFHTTVVIGFFL